MSNQNRSYQLIITLILISFLGTSGWLGYQNASSDVLANQLPLSSLNELSQLKVGEPVKVIGVIKRTYISKEGILTFTLQDDNNEIAISIFPSFGRLNKDFQIGDQIQAQGILSIYKNRYQLQPFSKDSIQFIKRNLNEIKLIQTPLHKIDDHRDEKVMVRVNEAYNVYSFTSQARKTHLSFIVSEGDLEVDAIMFEGLWSEEDQRVLNTSKDLYLIAEPRKEFDEWSLIVYEVFDDIESSELAIDEPSSEEEAHIELSNINRYLREKVSIGPVTFEDFEIYTSQSGKEHLRFDVHQDRSIVPAILFEGSWSDRDLEMMTSNQEYYIEATVSEYSGAISLIVNEIKE
ncbi:OB-fold nucleic acid binding domain-containing protein [Exiguobacterium sp. s195]|uniref:OB-fold nucleic acid binding domain-containing protein n=1 Tax=Exiguobacterium sp. s195 TaxID=2751282 RepID=UPI001BE95564|nr:OB-fold nucleic acid binding domain-containing protein [Exiguobacterium sp. s195]